MVTADNKCTGFGDKIAVGPVDVCFILATSQHNDSNNSKLYSSFRLTHTGCSNISLFN